MKRSRLIFLFPLCTILLNSASASVVSVDWKTPGDGLSLRPGDVIVNSLNRIIQYRADGTEVFRFDGAGTEYGVFEGAAIISGRRVATTRRLPVPGVVIIGASGVVSFDTPTVEVPGDVSVFDDGTFAISDQAGDIDIYSSTGSYVTSITHPGLQAPFGSTVDPDDTLWVAGFGNEIFRFNQSGESLGDVSIVFSVAELAIDHADDTLWIPSADGVIHQFDAYGFELFSFPTTVTPPFVHSIAIAPDRTLYVSSVNSSQIYHYDRSGALLDSFFHNNGRPLFMNVAFIPEPSTVSLALCALALSLRSRRRAN